MIRPNAPSPRLSFASSIWLRTLPAFFLLVLMVFWAGCEKGDVGPAGPPGSSTQAVLAFLGDPPALRADGASSASLKVRAATPQGNRLVGVPVTFGVESGQGSVSPPQAMTDGLGEAATTFVSGDQSGTAIVTATMDWHGESIAAVESLYVDPLAVSPPLLTSSLGLAVAPHWSPDGNWIFIEDSSGRQLRLVSASGGSDTYFGPYLGGVSSPDGSDRLVVYTSTEDSVLVLSTQGSILAGPMYPHPQHGYFFGDIYAVGWVRDGDSLAVASNTNCLLAISSLDGTVGRAFELPVWARDLSPAGGSVLILQGVGEYSGGIYRLALDTGATTLIVPDADYWSSDGPEVLGISVDPSGNDLVYSARTLRYGGYTADHDLHLVPSAGGQSELLLASPYEELYPEWSPNGNKVAFCSNRSGWGFNVYVYTVATTARGEVRPPGPSRPEESQALKDPGVLRALRKTRGLASSEEFGFLSSLRISQ